MTGVASRLSQAAEALVAWLDRMRFMMRVEVSDVSDELAVVWRPAAVGPAPYSGYQVVPRAQLTTFAEAAGPAAGLWAFEALRIARGEPRIGLDTDHRTIPNEVGWIGPRCTSTRAATEARRPSPGCTRSAGSRVGSRCCTSTARRTGYPRGARRSSTTAGRPASSAPAPGTASSGRSPSPW